LTASLIFRRLPWEHTPRASSSLLTVSCRRSSILTRNSLLIEATQFRKLGLTLLRRLMLSWRMPSKTQWRTPSLISRNTSRLMVQMSCLFSEFLLTWISTLEPIGLLCTSHLKLKSWLVSSPSWRELDYSQRTLEDLSYLSVKPDKF
jgi:hypothetical protein